MPHVVTVSKKEDSYLPTTISSHSEALVLKLFHRSMVKMVLALLKTEVSEDMRAAIITAIINPLSPNRENTHTELTKGDIRFFFLRQVEVLS